MRPNKPAWQVIPMFIVGLAMEFLSTFAAGCLPIIVVAGIALYLGIQGLMQSPIILAISAALLIFQGVLWTIGRD